MKNLAKFFDYYYLLKILKRNMIKSKSGFLRLFAGSEFSFIVAKL